jgi:iron complex outermembrane recepter protein
MLRYYVRIKKCVNEEGRALPIKKSKSVMGGLIASLMATSGFAQNLPAQQAEHMHEETIVVTASPVGARADELLQGVTVMGETALAETGAAGLGDILDKIPGISTTAFGPAASRPVIRGLGGDRVRMLINGIDIMDASTASPDHAVSAEALDATRIEVVRGPAAIVYGGNAIGGVVNIIDGRIPETRLDAPFEGRIVGGVSSVDNGNVGALRLRTGTGPWVFDAEAVRRRGGIEHIPGFARTAALRAVEGGGPRDRLPNSDLTFNTRALGGSYVGNWGFAGVSVKRSTANYGLPQEETARIDMAQTRIDARSEIRLPFRAFDRFSLDFGTSNYRHFELENGAIGTRFDKQGWELRTRVHQNELAGWTGSFGIDAASKTFSALGTESFLPKTRTRNYGGFIAERRDYGHWGLEGGFRLETRDLSTAIYSRNFTGISASAGVFTHLNENAFLSLSVSRTTRAPTDIELYSDGPHLSESAFERGNPDLKKESALSLEAIARFHTRGWDTHINLFRSKFSDFIFLNPTGSIIDGLTEFIYLQNNATLSGTEVFAERDLWNTGSLTFSSDVALEYVRAKTNHFGDLPRIPPLEITGGLKLSMNRIDARAELVWTDQQNKTAGFETTTKGSSIINFSTTVRPLATNDQVRLVFKLTNLTNATHRTHASFLKDRVPAAGRSFSSRLIVDF